MMSEAGRLTDSELNLLRGVDTPTICNVIELFDVRPRNAGYMDGRVKSCFPDFPPMVGYATTATFRSHQPPRGGDAYASLERQLEALAKAPPPPVVVFQDLDDPPAAATFGEVMCSTYKAFGAAGLITSGAGRDLAQVRALGFPAFTTGTICSHAYCHILQLDIPVHVGGLTICPGDLLHGDCNGVTTIPLAIAGEVARACKEIMDAESEVLDYVKMANPTIDGFTSARKRMTDRFAKLAKSVSQKADKL